MGEIINVLVMKPVGTLYLWFDWIHKHRCRKTI